MSQNIKDLFEKMTDKDSRLNAYSLVYFIIIIILVDKIDIIGEKLYISLILCQCLTWGILIQKEWKYLLMSDYYKYLKHDGERYKEIHKQSCKMLSTKLDLISSIVHSMLYAFPSFLSFIVISNILPIMGISGYLLCILMLLQIVWIVFFFIDWSIKSKDITKED